MTTRKRTNTKTSKTEDATIIEVGADKRRHIQKTLEANGEPKILEWPVLYIEEYCRFKTEKASNSYTTGNGLTVMPFADGGLRIKSFYTEERYYFDLNKTAGTGTELEYVLTDKIPAHNKKIMVKSNELQIEKFKEIYKNLDILRWRKDHKSKTEHFHIVEEQKKVPILGTFIVKQKGQELLGVPFYNKKEADGSFKTPTGIQYRTGDSNLKQKCEPGSVIYGSVHVLEDDPNEIANQKLPIIFSESITTAATIKFCTTGFRVVCGAGLGSIMRSIKTMKVMYPGCDITVAMDSPKDVDSDTTKEAHDKKTKEVEAEGCKVITIPDEEVDMTDFNDYQCAYDEVKCRDLLTAELVRCKAIYKPDEVSPEFIKAHEEQENRKDYTDGVSFKEYHPVAEYYNVPPVGSYVHDDNMCAPLYLDRDNKGRFSYPSAIKQMYIDPDTGKPESEYMEGGNKQGAVGVLSEGTVCDIIQKRTVILAPSPEEAYTILACSQGLGVMWCEGLGEIEEAILTINRLYPDSLIIVDLIKSTSKSTSGSKAEISGARTTLSANNIPFFCPPIKESSVSNFNDYLLKEGKSKCDKLINDLMGPLLHVAPEFLKKENNRYHFNMLHNDQVEIIHGGVKLWANYKSLLPKGYIEAYKNACDSEGMKEEDFADLYLRTECVKGEVGLPIRGVGMVKDRLGSYVSNIRGCRLVYKNGILTRGRRRVIEGAYKFEKLNPPSEKGATPEDILNSRFTYDDFSDMKNMFSLAYGENISTPFIGVAWAAQACFAHFSEFRPHLYLIGEPNNGKSFMLEGILKQLFRGFVIDSQASTKAAISQRIFNPDTMRCDTPLLFQDETNNPDENSQKNVLEVTSFLRLLASQDPDKEYILGKKDHIGISGKMLACMARASVEHGMTDPQDTSRHIILDVTHRLMPGVKSEVTNPIANKCLQLNSKIINQVARSAERFLKAEALSKPYLYKLSEQIGSDNENYVHLVKSLISCLAGLSAIIPKDNIEEAVEEAYMLLKDEIIRELNYFIDLHNSATDIALEIARFIVRTPGYAEMSMIKALTHTEEDVRKYIWDNYGIYEKDGALGIKLDCKQLVNLVSKNTNYSTPIRDIKVRLDEACPTYGSTKYKARKRNASPGELIAHRGPRRPKKDTAANSVTQRMYVLPVPEEATTTMPVNLPETAVQEADKDNIKSIKPDTETEAELTKEESEAFFKG